MVCLSLTPDFVLEDCRQVGQHQRLRGHRDAVLTPGSPAERLDPGIHPHVVKGLVPRLTAETWSAGAYLNIEFGTVRLYGCVR